MDNFDYKKYLVENKLTSNSRMLNEDNLEVKNIAKQLYSFLTKEGLKTELNVGLANARTTSIGNSELKGKPGEDMAMITYHDDPKIKQAVIYIRLGGEEERILQVEKKIGQFLPSNLEQYDRKILNQDSTNYRIEFRVKEKTTAKGGLVENKLTSNSRNLNEEESLIDYANKIAKEHNLILLQQPLGKPELYSMFIKEKGSFGDKNGVMTYQPNSKIVSVLSNDEKIPQAAFIQFKRDRGGNDAGFETKTFNIEGGGPKGYYKNFQITN